MTPDWSHSDTVGRVTKKVMVEGGEFALLTHFLRQRFFTIFHQFRQNFEEYIGVLFEYISLKFSLNIPQNSYPQQFDGVEFDYVAFSACI